MNPIVIRKANTDDIPALISLWRELHDLHSTYSPIWMAIPDPTKPVTDMFTKFLETQEHGLFVAEAHGIVAGFISISVLQRPEAFACQRYGYVYDLSVTEPMRRRGIGTALFDEACRWFASNGISRVELSYALANPSATKFWQVAGFQPYLQRCFRYLDES